MIFRCCLSPFSHQHILLQTITYGAKCRQYVCQGIKGRDMNKNNEKLHAVSETESKVWKHQEYARKTDLHVLLRMPRNGWDLTGKGAVSSPLAGEAS